jgi:hypothetical protein
MFALMDEFNDLVDPIRARYPHLEREIRIEYLSGPERVRAAPTVDASRTLVPSPLRTWWCIAAELTRLMRDLKSDAKAAPGVRALT